MTCPGCGQEVKDKALSCQQCGYEFEPGLAHEENVGQSASLQLKAQDYKFNMMDLIIGRSGTTDVGIVSTGIAGLLLSVIFYFVIEIPQLSNTYFHAIFAERGKIPYAIIFLFFWTATMLANKLLKISDQKSAFNIELIPSSIRKISLQNVDHIMRNIQQKVPDPRSKILSNRIWTALAHYKALGAVEEVDDILIHQSEIDTAVMDSSYSISKVFIWAIPILGFIGTVLGIGSAVGGFSEFTKAALEIDEIKNALDGITSGLSIAFDTTLVGLVCAMVLMIPSVVIQKFDETLLSLIEVFCIDNILNKLQPTEGQATYQVEAITSENAAARFKRIIEQTFQNHLKMLEESFSSWSSGFSGVMSEVTGHTKALGQEVAAIKPIATTFKETMSSFTDQLNTVAGQQTKILTDVHQQLENLQPFITGLNKISESLSEERRMFQEEVHIWIQNLDKLSNNLLMKFDEQHSKQLDSLNKMNDTASQQQERFQENVSSWLNNFESISQKVTAGFEGQLDKLEQSTTTFNQMLEQETKIISQLGENATMLGSFDSNLSNMLESFNNIMTKEAEIIQLINRNFEQLSVSDSQFKDTLTGIRVGLEGLRPTMEQLARPRTVRLVEE